MKYLAIINPSSGTKIFQRKALMAMHILSSEGIIDGAYFEYTRSKCHAYRIAKEIKKGQYDFCLVVGGDGTANEVVNGIIDGGSQTPICIVPAGTVNDFASFLGLPRDTENIVRMIKDFKLLPCDVGKVDDHYFLNVVAGGTLSDVAHNVTTEAKTELGRLAYYLEGARNLSSLRFNHMHLCISIDGHTFEEKKAFLFAIANSPSVGGFPNLLPKAKINDGYLDFLLLKDVNATDILPLMLQISVGNHINNPKVIYKQCKTIKVENLSEKKSPIYDYDGEEGGPLPVNAEILPKAINIIVPASCLENFERNKI